LSALLDRGEGYGCYAVIAAATVGGVILCFTPMDPIKALFWSAVLNGTIAVPIMVLMLLLASRRSTMGEHIIGGRLRWFGCIAIVVMAATVAAMLLTLYLGAIHFFSTLHQPAAVLLTHCGDRAPDRAGVKANATFMARKKAEEVPARLLQAARGKGLLQHPQPKAVNDLFEHLPTEGTPTCA
jgi:hypothetical protein